MYSLSKEQNVVLRLSAKSIAKGDFDLQFSKDELLSVSWEKVLEEAISQTVVLATFDAITPYKDYVPTDVYKKWKDLSLSILKSNLIVLNSQCDLISLLGDRPYVILKGSAVAVNYPKPELRSLGDVDFLIDPKDKDELEKLFIDNGYEKSQGEHPNHVVFQKPGANLEMHFEVAGVPFGTQGEMVKNFLKDAVFNPEAKTQDFSTFNAPLDKYNALILILHMQHHMLGDGFGIRHLCDWATFINNTVDRPFWDELLAFLDDVGLLT